MESWRARAALSAGGLSGARFLHAGELSERVMLERIVAAARRILGAGEVTLEVFGSPRSAAEVLRSTSSPNGEQEWRSDPSDVREELTGSSPRFNRDLSREGGPTLSAPVYVQDRLAAQMTVAGKDDDSGFTPQDQDTANLLADVLASVIGEAHLAHEQRRRELWLVKLHGITRLLLVGAEPEHVLRLVAKGARELADADVSVVVMLEPAAPGRLVVRSADGEGSDTIAGMELDVDRSVFGEVIRTGTPRFVQDASIEPLPAEDILLEGSVGPAMFIPLVLEGQPAGTLAVARSSEKTAFDEMDVRLVETFAAQASLALDYEHVRRQQERLAVLRDEERIARDLHDNVIQQIFATGIALQSTLSRVRDPEVARRLRQAVEELDTTIRDIRSTIFALQSAGDDHSVRADIVRLATEMGWSYGFRTHVNVRNSLDVEVTPPVTDHVLAALREALSNVARHANASEVEVSLVIGPEIVLTVVDDGVGIPPDLPRQSGLRNLDERVRALGGTMSMSRRPEGGSVLEWRVPYAPRGGG